MVENSVPDPQVGRILDTNRVPDTFFGPESRKSPDLVPPAPKMMKNPQKS